MNPVALAQLTKKIIAEIDPDSNREGLQKTPERVAKAWQKICGGYEQKVDEVMTTFSAENFDEMILVREVEFYSTCEHHLLPFFGTATIAYIPNEKIIGLSKIPRVVDIFSRRLQNQERITTQIADAFMQHLTPKGVGVVLSAKHFCMMARGVEKQNATVQTSALRGNFKNDPRTRSEFLQLLRG